MNNLFGMMQGQQMPGNIMQRFQQFQQMLNNGQVSQQQYNQAVQMAQQFQRMLGK